MINIDKLFIAIKVFLCFALNLEFIIHSIPELKLSS